MISSNFFYLLVFQKSDDTVRITDRGYFRSGDHNSTVCAGNCILKALLNAGRTIQKYVIELIP